VRIGLDRLRPVPQEDALRGIEIRAWLGRLFISAT
jgi:hypothetical protein